MFVKEKGENRLFFRLQCHIVVDDFGVRGNRPEDNRKVAVIMRVRNIITQVVKTDGRIKVNDFVFLFTTLSSPLPVARLVCMVGACVRRLFACKTIAFRSNTRRVLFFLSPFFYSPYLIPFHHLRLSNTVDG